MKKTIIAPVISIPIDIYFCDVEEFKKGIEKTFDIQMKVSNVFDGLCVSLENKILGINNIVIYIEDTKQYDSVPIGTIYHESFHAVCQIRNIMLNDPDELIISEQSEEDWAYMLEHVASSVTEKIMDMQKILKRKHEKTASKTIE